MIKINDNDYGKRYKMPATWQQRVSKVELNESESLCNQQTDGDIFLPAMHPDENR